MVKESKSSSTIVLKGQLVGSGPMRGEPNDPNLEAWQNATNIVVSFSVDLGELSIDVVDQTGKMVYQTTVDAIAGDSLVIDTRKWKTLSYTITICNDENDCAEGSFDID